MVTIVNDLDSLSIQEPVFKDVKYYLSGDVSERIMQLLQAGGAENTKYFSDYVTHLICGTNAADTDLDDAQDIYQIPAVTENWVLACARLKKLANPKPYFPSKNKIFSNVIACVSKVSSTDAKALFALITYNGGKVKLNLDTECSHLICGSASGKKYNAALSLASKVKIVTPDWVLESLRARIQAVNEVFHPKLLIVPQPPPKPMDRISAITGFDFEEGIAKNEVPTQNMTENKDESTQALLDKLKQRMPWNHPPSSANSSVVTSSINSMGYTTAMSSSSIASKSIPQGIVTQNMQIQGSQANTQFIQKLGQNTIVSQAGMNPPNQQVNLQQSYNQGQQPQQQQPHGLSAIQIQQQKLLQQHQLRVQMLQQKMGNQQNQQGFAQPNVSAAQITQNINNQIQQHMQSNQHHIQQTQNINQNPTTSMSSAQQQIENISQMLSQSANNMQQAQLNQQNMAMKQGLTLSQQSAVQNIAQQLAQSTQNLQQSLQNAKLNQQNLGQTQVMNQQQLISSGQQMSNQNQGMIQQQSVQSMTNQQQNMNMGVVNQQGLVSSSPGQSGQGAQMNQLVSNNNQQSVISQQIQTVQQTIQNQQGNTVPVQGAWRQQNIQMVQNVQGQHQIIRSPLVQSRNSQNQVILQQQIMQTPQQAMINNQQAQLSPQHTIQQTPQQILQQTINSQGHTINQTHHQILVQKQQLLNGSPQQIVQGPQQVLINQHTGQQQILVHGNQQVTLQGGQQLVSQSQIVHQGGQIVNQGGQQIITQGGQQVLSQGGQHVITQQGQQHQVVIAQSSQQLVAQSGQQIIGQTQQVLSQVPQSPQPGSQLAGGGIQQIITHSGGQQIVSPGGQQIVQGQNVTWQQQQYLQQRQQIGQPGAVGPRVSWSAGGGRQLIHLDAQTHAQLQQMDSQQRAMFVAQLQKRRQLSIQRAAALAQQQPGAGAPGSAPAQSVTFIRSQLPPGLTQQQQVQWLQQQGARTTTLPAAQPSQPPQSPVGTVGGSVGPAAVAGTVETPLQQLQRQQQFQRLQQLQAQRDHAQHHHQAAKQIAPVTQHVTPLQEQQVDALLTPTTPEQQQAGAGALLVNPKTKTALANMLSIRLQGSATPTDHEPSAAGTLRLMTAAHAAGGAARGPARLLLGPAHAHTHAAPAPGVGSAGVGVGVGVAGTVASAGGKVYSGAVRAAPPRAQFYGHNPNLKLPPDLFLLGCVFHIVEYQQSVGNERVTRWTEAIVRRGGEVESGYCARVTHVLCETQRHGVVMQALRDAKRCVTAYWVADTLERRCVAPPWHALHLPALHARAERPAAHHRAALAGWRRDERRRLACCLRQIGAKMTAYMTRDNTVVICKRAEGTKYRRAREWGLPVVSAAWLTDLLLGNMTALSQIENAKYQQFNLGSPFRMDYSLVSHLMNAWKMPINITQESHERAKRSASSCPRRAKRARVEAAPAPGAPLAPPLHLAPRVLFSALPHHEQQRLATVVRQLGGLVVSSPSEATHLVMEKLVRTCKLVSCLITVKHLLTPEWVNESQRLNKFADEAKHALRDETFNKTFKCDVDEVLLCGEQRKKLFEGITFFLTPCVKPSRSGLTEMIELCGGKVEKNRRSYVSIQEMHTQRPYSYLVLTVPNDLHLVYYLLQSEKTLNVVCSTEVVMSAIMRQKLEIEECLVKID